MKLKRWTDSVREDLNMIPKMIDNGFKVEFNEKDIITHRTSLDLLPHEPVNFSKGKYFIWLMYKWVDVEYTAINFRRELKSYWVVAEYNPGDRRYSNHKHYDSLEDVINALK